MLIQSLFLRNLKLHDLCALHDLKICYKLINNMLQNYFNSIFIRNSDNHSFQTRHSNNFQLPIIRHSFAKNNIRFKIPTVYNTCPNSIKEKFFSHSITGFSAYVKQYCIAIYNYECNIVDCYICQRI